MEMEQKEVFFNIKRALNEAKNMGEIIPDNVFNIIEGLEKEYIEAYAELEKDLETYPEDIINNEIEEEDMFRPDLDNN